MVSYRLAVNGNLRVRHAVIKIENSPHNISAQSGIATRRKGHMKQQISPPRSGVANAELESFLDFVEQFDMEMERSLSIKKGYSETRILGTLLRDHLSGKTSTTSSLIGASGMSYGTAIRAVEAIEKRGAFAAPAAHIQW